MSEDQSSNGSGSKTWMERIGKVFSSEPRDRQELKELINESCEKGILDAEAVAMIEGALAVSEMQVRDARFGDVRSCTSTWAWHSFFDVALAVRYAPASAKGRNTTIHVCPVKDGQGVAHHLFWKRCGVAFNHDVQVTWQ